MILFLYKLFLLLYYLVICKFAVAPGFQFKMATRWLLIIVVILFATFPSRYSRHIFIQQDSECVEQTSISNSTVCLTPGCVKAAAGLLSNLDENVDPCKDFYRFACGGWLSQHTIPEDKSKVSVSSEVDDDLKINLKALMEKKLDGTEPSFIKKIKYMYDTCMDLESIEKAGAKPLKRNLRKLGGWPVVEGSNWDESNFDWVEALIHFRKLGYSHDILFDLSVGTDFRNNSLHTIQLDQTDLGMPDRSYLVRGLKDSATSAYFQLMVKSAKLLGADETIVEMELLEALHFEMALANYSLPEEERRNISKLYNKYTVKQLQEEVPQIPWLKYFNGLLNNEISENEILIVGVPEFVKMFANLITRTEKRVVANYMMWRVVYQYMSKLSKEWRDIHHEYRRVFSGKSQEQPRWKQCLLSLNGDLPIPLSSYYVRHYFKEESKDAALEIVKYIHKEFLHILDEIDWMGEETKRQAKAKAQAIKPYIGYPKELLNDTAVEEMYENLTLSSDNYFANARRLYKYATDDAFSELRKPSIKEDWKKHASVAAVNAYYFATENSIDFLAGIMQKAYFNKDRPNYMNFGAIGFVIGHEITHGFDDQGRQFDKDGNTVNWWDKRTDELFNEKAQCIIDQYSNYTAENGMKVNGVITQGENIADNGGLKEAYWAYRSWVKDNGQEQLLPGMNYSQNQVFWISAASVWCGKYRPEFLKLSLITDAHSPFEFRVNGPMSNLVEFSEEFNCSPDSPMNKKHKCEVW